MNMPVFVQSVLKIRFNPMLGSRDEIVKIIPMLLKPVFFIPSRSLASALHRSMETPSIRHLSVPFTAHHVAIPSKSISNIVETVSAVAWLAGNGNKRLTNG
jgi:hypothetical protein